MEENSFKKSLEVVATDTSLTLDERMDKMLNLWEDSVREESVDKTQIDIIAILCLTEMIEEDDGRTGYLDVLLNLYSLLAPAYIEKEDYRPLDFIARNVIAAIRYGEVSWEVMKKTLPPVLDALGETVFRHDLYELLVLYLRAAYEAGDLTKDQKGRIRKMLKLRTLLDYRCWADYKIDEDMQAAIIKVMQPEDLLKIILSPDTGGLRRDPVEYTSRWEEIYYDLEDRLDERFANAPRGRGFARIRWNAKRDILKEEYGIEWRSPALMNPRVKFD